MARIVVLISGSGTNLQAILDAVASGRLSGEVVAVISNRGKAYGLERAKKAGVPTEVLGFLPFKRAGRSREDYDAALAELVQSYEPDLVVLAGFMRILTPAFIDPLQGRILNLHPALPGQFPGADGIGDAFKAFQRGEVDHTGVMVHWVIPEVDAGPVVATAVVPIEENDTLETLEERIHRTEHELLVSAIDQVLRSSND